MLLLSCACTSSRCSEQRILEKAEDHQKRDSPLREGLEEDLKSTETHSVKRKQDIDPEPTERERKRRNSAVDDSNVSPVIKRI